MAGTLARLALIEAVAWIGVWPVSEPAHAAGGAGAHAQPISTIVFPRARSRPGSQDASHQICTKTRITGSRFVRRIGRTAIAANNVREETQDAVREFQQHGGASVPAIPRRRAS